MLNLKHSGALEVVVVEGKNLPGRDVYCKLKVRNQERRTYVKTKRDAVWDQKLVFNLEGGNEVGLKLIISVMESNIFAADEWLGGVEIPLTQLKHNVTVRCVMDISRNGQVRQLIVSLCWYLHQSANSASVSSTRPLPSNLSTVESGEAARSTQITHKIAQGLTRKTKELVKHAREGCEECEELDKEVEDGVGNIGEEAGGHTQDEPTAKGYTESKSSINNEARIRYTVWISWHAFFYIEP
jgi:Ca2+-dependent lipid-binding protein